MFKKGIGNEGQKKSKKEVGVARESPANGRSHKQHRNEGRQINACASTA
jgi:hypothetical protein